MLGFPPCNCLNKLSGTLFQACWRTRYSPSVSTGKIPHNLNDVFHRKHGTSELDIGKDVTKYEDFSVIGDSDEGNSDDNVRKTFFFSSTFIQQQTFVYT